VGKGGGGRVMDGIVNEHTGRVSKRANGTGDCEGVLRLRGLWQLRLLWRYPRHTAVGNGLPAEQV